MDLSSLRLLPIPLLALLAAGCGPSPTEPTQYAAFSQQDLQLGTGDPVALGDVMRVHYTLWLFDEEAPDRKGALIETTAGHDPLRLRLGASGTIQGWIQGVPGMRTGGIRRLIIPPDLAYGAIRNGIIPPNATLVFEIELIEIEEAEP